MIDKINEPFIQKGLELLDIHFKHCLKKGANKNLFNQFLYDAGGNREQNNYYNGNRNMLEAILIPYGYGITRNHAGKHSVYKMEG